MPDSSGSVSRLPPKLFFVLIADGDTDIWDWSSIKSNPQAGASSQGLNKLQVSYNNNVKSFKIGQNLNLDMSYFYLSTTKDLLS